MRVMVSQPMVGRSLEEINRERLSVINRLKEKGHEYVNTIIREQAPASRSQALWYLGKVLQIMSDCDAVLFMRGWDVARGCRIEHQAALDYGLQIMMESDLYPRHP